MDDGGYEWECGYFVSEYMILSDKGVRKDKDSDKDYYELLYEVQREVDIPPRHDDMRIRNNESEHGGVEPICMVKR